MNAHTIEALEKLLQAKKLEKEAMLTLLPGDMNRHLDVIGKEVKAMIIECVMALNSEETTTDHSKETEKKTRVRKVDIG